MRTWISQPHLLNWRTRWSAYSPLRFLSWRSDGNRMNTACQHITGSTQVSESIQNTVDRQNTVGILQTVCYQCSYCTQSAHSTHVIISISWIITRPALSNPPSSQLDRYPLIRNFFRLSENIEATEKAIAVIFLACCNELVILCTLGVGHRDSAVWQPKHNVFHNSCG